MEGFDFSHDDFKVTSIKGRYLAPDQFDAFLASCPSSVNITKLGQSVEGRAVHMLELGSGNTKILMWSQMHGNESTTTKAVLDLVNFLTSQNALAKEFLNKCRFRIIPMLNPDGAFHYTRENARGVDLNRDAQELTQPESQYLRKTYESFEPHFCFNLHDQRTIYNVGQSGQPATLSFLAPSRDAERSIDQTREASMQVIAAINEKLQKEIPGQIGRYDDAFNSNCIGDALQMQGTPTLLFEAGHYPGDYSREVTRGFMFLSLITAIQAIHLKSYLQYDVRSYFNIPENNKLFFDVLIRNKNAADTASERGDVGIMFKEILEGDTIQFTPYIEERGDLSGRFGHETYDLSDARNRDFLLNSPFRDLLEI